MKINERIYSDAEIKLIKEIFDMYIERIYDEDLEDLVSQCKEMFLDNQKLMKENKILRENAENNVKVVDKVNWENKRLIKENEELKKIQCTFLGTGCKAEIERLNNIINKAIEYIKHYCIDDEFYINLSDKEKGIVNALVILENGVDKN